MKKNRINTTSIREIKSSFKRFISLLVMSMLGVGVFVGISSTAPNMMKSIDTYYDKTNTYDIKLVSTLGLTDDDISKINDLEEIKKAYGTYSKDVLVSNDENEFVIKINSINNNINVVDIEKGRLPKKSNEIVVEEEMLKKEKLKIGDKVSIEEDETFKNKIFKIVGVVKSPLYITNATSSSNRGNTTIGNGKINYYTYVNKNAFDIDYYTEMYVVVKNAKNELTNSNKYNELITKAKKSINSIKTSREKHRYDDIYNEAESKILEEEKNGLDELNIAKRKLDNTKKELDNGKSNLDSKKILLDNTSSELQVTKEKLSSVNSSLNEAEKKLNNAKETLDSNKLKLDETRKAIDDNKFLIDQSLELYNLTVDDLNELIRILDDTKLYQINQIINDNYLNIKTFVHGINENTTEDEIKTYINSIGITTIIDNDEEVQLIVDYIKENYDKVEYIIDNLDAKKVNILNLIYAIRQINESEDNYTLGLMEYNYALENYNTENLKYSTGKEEYDESYKLYLNYNSKYQRGLNEYNEGIKSYYSNLNLYNTGIEEYYNSKRMFDERIGESKEKLNDIEKCTWYVYERIDDIDYSSYIDDGNSVSNLSKVFPTIFFIVAILISLISMSRMVEDDRLLIGTLKSLGFSNKHIRKKYIIYSGVATLLGSILGSLLGFFLLPRYIWNIYKILFIVPIFRYDYNPKNVIIGTLIAIICICGTTLLTIKKVVKEKPSDLMRPKAPEGGKRVILERIPFIWNNINFSNKITIRNLFRYKKRVLMTVGGILGCTALMLAGFGIRDSIVDVPSMQYKEIFLFDEMAYLTGELNKNEIDNIFDNKHITSRVDTKMDVSMITEGYSLNIFVPDNDKDIKYILDLRDVKTKEKLILEKDKIVISDKLSQLTNKKVGDKLNIIDSSNKTYEFVISGVCENYVGHYVFMNKNTYEEHIGKYTTNLVYFNLDKLSSEKNLTKKLLDNENIMSITSINSTINSVNNMLKTLNSVVLVLIFLSGALSFVVLYNLSYINISERKREIATLKVLGFTDKEVDNYITKENIILTIIGIILGLIFGVFLSNVIINTVEIEKIRFMRTVNSISFIITIFMIMLFTFIVNIITHFTLKKIDMIESLKSVE